MSLKKGLYVASLGVAFLSVYSTNSVTDFRFDTVVMAEEVSREFKNALKTAQRYANKMHMSKQGIYDQLVSEYGEKFPEEAAQYAIDNLKVDFKKNALKTAENYSKRMYMSKQGIYDQLISEFGERFTEEEAQYAIDNLKE